MDQYQEYIAASRYARYQDDKGRRESWPETVTRFVEYIFSRTPAITDNVKLKEELYNSIVKLELMPSMRAMMTAGKSADRDNTCVYNCSYLPVDDVKSFDEAMFILLCGTGVGFSVESKYINQLPEVPEKMFDSEHTISVHDSKEGWAKSLRLLLANLWAGEIPKWDVSNVRPAGTRLKTFGGRASGPEPLIDLFQFAVATFKHAKGRRLNSLECHDLMCKIGEVVVVGGVRRSAMISLSDLDDERIRHAKAGPWWDTAPHRALANNSAVYNETPTVGKFMEEWLSLYNSHSGERGIFNREAARKTVEKYGHRDPNFEFGTNPCSEIVIAFFFLSPPIKKAVFCGPYPILANDFIMDTTSLLNLEGYFQSGLLDLLNFGLYVWISLYSKSIAACFDRPLTRIDTMSAIVKPVANNSFNFFWWSFVLFEPRHSHARS